jgi:hypothetical protein
MVQCACTDEPWSSKVNFIKRFCCIVSVKVQLVFCLPNGQNRRYHLPVHKTSFSFRALPRSQLYRSTMKHFACDVTLSVYPHRASLKCLPTVARLIFQACPMWIYTQINITNIIFTWVHYRKNNETFIDRSTIECVQCACRGSTMKFQSSFFKLY